MLIGHQKQWDNLKSAYSNDSLSHAYLFSGPDQVGKKTLALEFIKMINCQEESFEKKPCNVCSSCQMINRLAHPDFMFVGLEEEKTEIEVEQVRNLINRLSFKPFSANYKIGLIDDAHLMNIQAQNCLLKTLEEPRGDTVLVLISSHREILLETVLSRIQEIFFSLVPEHDMREFLIGQKLGEEDMNKILRFSFGKPGRIIEFLQGSSRLTKEKKTEKGLADILQSDLGARFDRAEALAKNYSPEILEIWLRYLRSMLLEKIERREDAVKTKKNIENLEKVIFLINKFPVNKRLVLENLMINLD